MGAVRGNYWIALPGSVIKASPEQLRPAVREERHAWRLVEAELRTKLVNSPPIDEEDEERQPQSRHLRNQGGRRITAKATVSGEYPEQMRCLGPRVTNGDGKRPRVENEAAPGDTTDATKDVDPEVTRQVMDAPVPVQPQVPGGIVYPRGLPFPQETSCAPVRGRG